MKSLEKNTRHFEQDFQDSQNLVSYASGNEEGRAIQLIKVQAGNIELSNEGLDIIANCDMPVGFCCICGKYRTGKSFLLNKLLQLQGTGFRVDPSTKACTEGIWMWSQPLLNEREGNYIFFLDTQGMASLSRDSETDAKIFTLANLMSSYIIFNTVGSIDEKSISELNLVTQLSKNIILEEHLDLRSNEEKLFRYMPKFMWLLRDFTLELADENGKRLSPVEYLESSLFDQSQVIKTNESIKKIRRALTKYYKDRDCMTLVRPANEESSLQQLNSLPNHALRREFLDGINRLREKIKTCAGPKMYENQPLYGSMVTSMIESYVHVMNNGGIPSIKTAWDNINEDQGLNAYDLALERFNDLYEQNFQEDEPKGEEIYHLLRVLSEASLNEFNRNITQQNNQYQVKLKDFLSSKEENIIQINKQLIKHKNIEILQSCMAPVLQDIESGYYNNNTAQLNSDVKQATEKYNRAAKGEVKADLLSDFLADLNPVILEIQQKSQVGAPAEMKSHERDEYEAKILNLQRRLESVNNQALANKNALQNKNKKTDAKASAATDKKKRNKKDVDPNAVGCCGTKSSCIIM